MSDAKPKHSEGPWSAEDTFGTDEKGKMTPLVSQCVVGGGEGLILATVWGRYVGPRKAVANADLMAAAPELLAACLALRCALAGWDDNGQQVAHAIALADSAIARAKGEALCSSPSPSS